MEHELLNLEEATDFVKVSKDKRRYKCPFCEYRDLRHLLANHVSEMHESEIPEGSSSAKIVFDYLNKGRIAHCIECGRPTDWDESTWKYKRICSDACSKKFHAKKKADMIRVYNKPTLLDDEEHQKKMLDNRSISGKYKFQDGGVRTYVGTYEKNRLEFLDIIFNMHSDNIVTPGPVIEYMFDGKSHKWITDCYIISHNLVIDDKPGGNNKQTHPGMKEYFLKQDAKEDAIQQLGKYNYIRLTDNNFSQLMDALMEIKFNMKFEDDTRVHNINEDALSTADRNDLPKTDFGLRDDRKFPLTDKTHVISAISYFDTCEPSKKPQLAKAIYRKNKSKKYGIELPVKILKYIKEDFILESVEEDNTELPKNVYGLKIEKDYPLNSKEQLINAVRSFDACDIDDKPELATNIFHANQNNSYGVQICDKIMRYVKEDIQLSEYFGGSPIVGRYVVNYDDTKETGHVVASNKLMDCVYSQTADGVIKKHDKDFLKDKEYSMYRYKGNNPYLLEELDHLVKTKEIKEDYYLINTIVGIKGLTEADLKYSNDFELVYKSESIDNSTYKERLKALDESITRIIPSKISFPMITESNIIAKNKIIRGTELDLREDIEGFFLCNEDYRTPSFKLESLQKDYVEMTDYLIKNKMHN